MKILSFKHASFLFFTSYEIKASYYSNLFSNEVLTNNKRLTGASNHLLGFQFEL